MTDTLTGPRLRQRPPTPGRALPPKLIERMEHYRDAGEAAVSEEFKGITTDGSVVPGLFSLRGSGVPADSIKQAAEAVLGMLSAEQRTRLLHPIESDAWRRWSNIHPYIMRHGVSLDEMDSAQRESVLGLLEATLSEHGFQTARDIMKLNHTIGEMSGKWDEYGEWLYWLSLMASPSSAEPWGWQIDGHHLIVNCLVVKDQLVVTPMFMGSEPVVAEAGIYAGTRVFDVEEQDGLALMLTLSAEQRRQALVSDELPVELFTAAYRDNLELRYEGIRYGQLSTTQQNRLLDLIQVYVGRVRPGHAAVKMDEVKAHLSETHFAWMGGFGEESVFYYRIHSPVILIEFDHQRGIAFDNDEPSRRHIHTVVRTPNGNDYGKDLLRQHYELAAHSHA